MDNQQRDNIYGALENTTSLQPDKQQQLAREVVPGAVIERGNTPRLSASAQSTFPAKAPSAPPLPEEGHEHEEQPLYAAETTTRPTAITYTGQNSQEFFWLFEYGLEMDNTYLNHPQRLNGLALPYGTATLRGYRLAFGTLAHDTLAGEQVTKTYITLLPDQSAHSEVWGFLYRVPRRVVQSNNEQPALLHSIHHAHKTHALYQTEEVLAHETLRGRDIPCVTYILTANAQHQLYALSSSHYEQNETVQALASIAKEKRFPQQYIQTWSTPPTALTHFIPPTPSALPILPAPHSAPASFPSRPSHSQLAQKARKETLVAPVSEVPQTPQMPQEQNTEPLLLLKEQQRTQLKDDVGRRAPARTETPMLIVATYQLLLLLGALALLVLQGINVLDTPVLTFQAAAIPWLVLVYGLIGGSISGIVTLAHRHRQYQGPILSVIWLVRPFIGSVCALLAYLLLNSNLLSFNFASNHFAALCLLISTVAGFGEGWLFRNV